MPTNKLRATSRDEREAERKNAALEQKRAELQTKLDEHNRRVRQQAAAQSARSKPGRIVSTPRPAPFVPAPFDPEAGRNRRARPLPGTQGIYAGISSGMPAGAATAFGPKLSCPHCGAPMLSYTRRGRYHCSTRRLSTKGIGCGRYSYGPHNPTETAYSDAERRVLDTDDLLPE